MSMKKIKPTLVFLLIPVIIFSLTSFTSNEVKTIEWLTWEEAIKKVETDKNPKKIFVDVYTDWCGWCKKMDKDTFNNPEVAAYMTEHIYMVKMDVERKEPIDNNRSNFKYVTQRRKGYH